MNSTQQQTEVVRASEMREKVIQRIWDIRTGEDRSRTRQQYESDLAKYLKAKGRRKEFSITTTDLANVVKIGGEDWGKAQERKVTGYFKPDGVTFAPRPEKPRVQDDAPEVVWSYSSREVIGRRVFAAKSRGLLADSSFNRDIRPDRVEKYALEMEAGSWVDLLSDPIAITEDGQVLNGQHRLAAIFNVTEGFKNDPAFLVIWNVDPSEGLYADGSHRTAIDEKTIAVKLVKRATA